MGDEREEQGMGDVRDMRDVADVIDVRAVRDMTRYEQTMFRKFLTFSFFWMNPSLIHNVFGYMLFLKQKVLSICYIFYHA